MPALLEKAAPSSLDLDPKALERLHETITRHVAEGRYPGAQYAVARHGKLAVASTIGDARTDPARVAAPLASSFMNAARAIGTGGGGAGERSAGW